MKDTVIIIPARYKSTRFPGKPLALIKKIPMIVRVLNICSKVLPKKKIFVATEDTKIFNLVKNSGYNSLITSKNHKTGTDRVAEVAEKIKAKIYINVQGDEPIINPKDIKKIIEVKKKNFSEIVCGYCILNKLDDPYDTNLIKVALNEKGYLLYMSRNPIPFSKNKISKIKFLKQVCIYAFNREELKFFRKFNKKSNNEKIEDIEILRFFESNKKIRMVKLSKGSIAVDSKKDIKKVERYIK
jgi:3-deoxy-manno-octulosonate cytidylyltransferase (CMP-KDO synthetase)